jgi:ABC-type phosphate transport system substrate-binding protein
MKKLLVVIAILVVSGIEARAQIAVIVNKSTGISTATASNVSDIYTLSTKEWKDGSPIVVFDQKTEGATRTKFYEFITKSPIELKKIWMRIQLSGEGKAPTAVSSDDEMVQKVASTAGAIGFVAASKATGDVKVVATIN